VQPVGEGTIRKAADLLQAKLAAEGLFDAERKRPVPYPPRRVALITAAGSAAYADFIKILNVRWRGVTVDHYDVLVQGEQAPAQIVAAITAANAGAEPPDVLVVTRGGGSAEDIAAFSHEQVTRAVALSRPAELAADQRASTPSNVAELLTPDRKVVLRQLTELRQELGEDLLAIVDDRKIWLNQQLTELNRGLKVSFETTRFRVHTMRQLLEAYNPTAALQRGYALVRADGRVIKSVTSLQVGREVELQLSDGTAAATITKTEEL
jgi:exodeoxyribonuclease VII large subunit